MGAEISPTGTPAIDITGLRKVYRRRGRKRVAVDNLDLYVEAGQVHGFLGPNGAGKTTTIRALLGLIRADAGQLRVFGHEVPERLGAVIGDVGVVVEQSQLYPYFSARRNLRLLATIAKVDSRRVDEKLELVGLADRAKDEVRGFSLGMRQRLAIAAALMKEPRLLILDEPNNGLDPAGIREIRDLLRQLAADGASVLMSSHILAEIQQVCDTVSIVSAGRRVVTGPVSDVLATAATGEVLVRVDDLDTAQVALADAGMAARRIISDHAPEADYLIVSDMADPSWITQVLARRRLFVSELTPLAPDLESVFLDLTGAKPPNPTGGQPPVPPVKLAPYGHPADTAITVDRPLAADGVEIRPEPMNEAAVVRELSQFIPASDPEVRTQRAGRHAAREDDQLETTQEWSFDQEHGLNHRDAADPDRGQHR